MARVSNASNNHPKPIGYGACAIGGFETRYQEDWLDMPIKKLYQSNLSL
jgi:hypothetical protein